MASYVLWVFSRSFSIFLLSRVVGGICKGNVSLCTAMVADLRNPQARNRGMVSDLLIPCLLSLSYVCERGVGGKTEIFLITLTNRSPQRTQHRHTHFGTV